MRRLLRFLPALISAVDLSCSGPIPDDPAAGPDSSSTEEGEGAFLQLAGPYLGEAPALSTPALFAPGVVSEQVNMGQHRFNAFVDPDEGFLILTAVGMEDTQGGADYYIVFRNEQDEWSEPVNLGPLVNTAGSMEHSPYVSPDGQFFFFMSSRLDEADLAPGGIFDGAVLRQMVGKPENGAWDIYWMDAGFLNQLRPAGF